jgi:hypothetical protein
VIRMAFDPDSEGMSGIGQFRDQFAGMGPMVVTAVETIQGVIERVWPILTRAFDVITQAAEATFPLLATAGQIAFEVIGSIVEHVAPVVERALGFITREVIPPLQEAFAAIAAWVQENWPLISSVIDAAAQAIGAAFSAILAVLEAVWPVIVRIGEVVLPALGVAMQVLLPVLGTLLEVFSAVFTGIGEAVRFVVEDVITPIIDLIVGHFQEHVQPAFEDFGEAWTGIWETVSGVFETIWNGILSFIGEVVGNIIGVIASVMEAAAGIPGPWQEGAKDTAKALRGMEADAKTWGDNTTKTMRGSMQTMEKDARYYAGRTALAWGSEFASYSDELAANVAQAMKAPAGVLAAFSPPRHPMNPMRNIGVFAMRTADAYGDAFASRGGRIAEAVRRALEPAAGILEPDIHGSFVGSNERMLNATLEVRVTGDPAAIAALPGGAEGVAAELRKGIDATGFLRLLQHEVAIR